MNDNPIPIPFDQIADLPFDEVPGTARVKVYGVRYVFTVDEAGNEFYVTRLGWKFRFNLNAEQWYAQKRYLKEGQRLHVGSGHVYRVPTRSKYNQRQDLVVKFSRFAEAVPLHVAKTFPDKMPEDVGSAEFNDPFKEFGLLVDLRNGRFGPPDLRILTKHPVAIVSPAKRLAPWKLGREKTRFDRYRAGIANNLDPKYSKMDLGIDRQYIYIFAWVKGFDAAEHLEMGTLLQKEVRALTLRVEAELKAKGFRVLDNKPSHIILRRNKHGELIRRHGKLVYALVDFELLQRTDAYKDFLRELDRKHKQTEA